MQKWFLIVLVSCVGVSTVVGQSALPQIRVVGNRFVTPDGDAYIFKGVSISDPDNLLEQGHWTRSHFVEVKKWGANIVRFPIHPRAWRKHGQDAYLKILDEGVQWATELGLYVIMDWHSIGNLRTEMYQAPMYETTRKETYEFWRTLSKHYKGNSTIAFFELFNEPTTYGGQLGTITWEEWKRMVEDMITIIRANGSEAIPLVAGFNWAYDLKNVRENPIEAEGIAYVSHPYPMKREKPWESKWTEDFGFVSEEYPLILTEIGFSYENERGAHIPVIGDETYGDAITGYCEEKGISWVAWVFDPRWSPMLFYDWTYKPTPQGVYFRKAMQGK